MSKGSKPRPCNTQKFETEFDRIFGNQQPETDFESFVTGFESFVTDFESFTASPIGQGLKKDYMRELLSDGEFLWEAIGKDAVNIPAWVPLFDVQGDDLVAAEDEMRQFWDAEADKIATMIFEEDDTALGKYIRRMAESYIKPKVDLWLIENWEVLK